MVDEISEQSQRYRLSVVRQISVRVKTIKHLEKNTVSMLYEVGYDADLLKITTKAQAIKAKIN